MLSDSVRSFCLANAEEGRPKDGYPDDKMYTRFADPDRSDMRADGVWLDRRLDHRRPTTQLYPDSHLCSTSYP